MGPGYPGRRSPRETIFSCNARLEALRVVSRYLVVAHQTADSPTLLERVQELARADPEAEFVALAPVRALSWSQLAGGETRRPLQIAIWRAQRTKERLRSAGINAVAARPGLRDPWLDPLEVIEHEIRLHGPYRGVVISTLPHPFSRWLRRDVPHRLARRWPDVQVLNVVAPSWIYQALDGQALAGSTTS